MPSVYTDGSCLGNGQLGARAGWGVYFPADGAGYRGRLPGSLQTNQRAELHAIIVALNKICDKAGTFEVVTDSVYAKNSLEEWIPRWKLNGWRTAKGAPVKNKDLHVEMVRLHTLLADRVSFRFVYGHRGDPGNDVADNLARTAATLEEDVTFQPMSYLPAHDLRVT
ncbi:MAG: hypothetical protein KVP17_003180 [Porospora cf. gigantea B]|uniref:uncharacterized protein n=1 Tax=Porospora cf. gigantea B TaxID=2853592 RepID=UPI003571DACD|nr:MAG: hypothetical protein KVP17_003180 [Porospora cf. gigantea B]